MADQPAEAGLASRIGSRSPGRDDAHARNHARNHAHAKRALRKGLVVPSSLSPNAVMMAGIDRILLVVLLVVLLGFGLFLMAVWADLPGFPAFGDPGERPGLLPLLGALVLLSGSGLVAGRLWQARPSRLARLIAATDPAGIVVLDRSGTLRYATPAARHMAGVGERALESLMASVGLRSAAPGAIPCHDDVPPLRYQRRGEDGIESEHWLRVSLSPIGGRQGWCLYRIEDITAAHKAGLAEEARRSALERHAEALDAAPFGFALSDETGKILHLNRTLAAWLGRPAFAGQAEGLTTDSLLEPEPSSGIVPSAQPGHGCGPSGRMAGLRCGAGRIMPVRLVEGPLPEAAGHGLLGHWIFPESEDSPPRTMRPARLTLPPRSARCMRMRRPESPFSTPGGGFLNAMPPSAR